jgi:hypothetical protein
LQLKERIEKGYEHSGTVLSINSSCVEILEHNQASSNPRATYGHLWATTAELIELLQQGSHAPYSQNNSIWPFTEKFANPILGLKFIILIFKFHLIYLSN